MIFSRKKKYTKARISQRLHQKTGKQLFFIPKRFFVEKGQNWQ